MVNFETIGARHAMSKTKEYYFGMIEKAENAFRKAIAQSRFLHDDGENGGLRAEWEDHDLAQGRSEAYAECIPMLYVFFGYSEHDGIARIKDIRAEIDGADLETLRKQFCE